jgi:hypothetical protein
MELKKCPACKQMTPAKRPKCIHCENDIKKPQKKRNTPPSKQKKAKIQQKKIRENKPCNKKRYKNKKEAKIAQKIAKERHGALQTIYRCNQCNYWHLTKMRS